MRLTNYKIRIASPSQTVAIKSLAFMKNESERSPKTNHKGIFSLLQYYIKTKSQKWNRGWYYILSI
jgi:hypothetical protein